MKKISMEKKGGLITGCCLLICMVFIFSGCWDQIEIEQRSFVMAMGIDQFPATELKPAQIWEPGLLEKRPRQLLITMEIPKTGQTAAGQDQGGGAASLGGGGKEKPAWVPSMTGVNISQAISEMRIRSNRQIFLGHLRVIAVGDEFAGKEGLRNVLDFFFRDPEIQREVVLFIVNGRAQEVLKFIPPDVEQAAVYLSQVSILEKFSSRFFFITLGDLATDLLEDGDALIGRVRSTSNEAVTGGMAVIKDWKLAGFLGEIETMGANLLRNQLNRETIIVEDKPNHWYGINVFGVQREIKPIWNGRQLHLRYRFITEGKIEETPGSPGMTHSQQALKHLERLAAASLKEAAQAAMAKLQRGYQADAIGLGVYVRRHWPKIWRKLGPRWKEEFPRITVEIQVEHKIRRMGVFM